MRKLILGSLTISSAVAAQTPGARPRAVSAQRGSLLGARQQHQAGRHGGGGGAASGGLSRDDQPVRERPGGGGGAAGRPDLVRTRRSHVVRALLRRGYAGSGRVRL